MILYLDTSAFVKLVLDEPGATETRAWFERAQQPCASAITYPEATAALARHAREVGCDGERLAGWLTTLEKRWNECFRVRVFEQRAARLALAHPLRGMDAIQLGCACELRALVVADTPEVDVRFVAFDQRLLAAAEREGFATLGGYTD